MAIPVFTKFTVLDPELEIDQLQAAITGGPAGGGLDDRWDMDDYARLRSLQNSTSNAAVFNQWMVLDPQRRLNTLAGINLTWSPLAMTIARNPYAYTLPAGPPGKPAP